MKRLLIFALLMIPTLAAAQTQTAPQARDVLGAHNLAASSGTSPITGSGSAACLYCHAPHSGIGGRTPLWSQTLSTQTYTLYNSSTQQNTPTQPTLGASTSLCLSCHDGTVAPGQLAPYGNLSMSGSMYSADVFGANLKASHPVSMLTPLKDAPTLVASLAATQATADPLKAIKLVNGTVECTSCHEPHNQNIDPASPNFLLRDGSRGQICLACHEPNPRTVNGKNNPLAQWSNSIHATAGNAVAGQAQLGGYSTVAQVACLSCHAPHNANGASGLIRGPAVLNANMDAGTQACIACHSDASNLQPAAPNVMAEFAKGGHPYPSGSNTHDVSEPAVLVNNRHATCADCHNAHATVASTFNPAPAIRGAQTGVVGVSANDGTTVVTPAVNQYENCLRCHGNSPGKQTNQSFGYTPVRAVSAADPLNLVPQMAATATSSHPVTHAASSSWPQPSLLPNMLNQNGTANVARIMGPGAVILCTDCHNSDDNREFGGAGANGPHGSQYSHILERRYEFSQVAPGNSPPLNGPGSPIQNLFVNPNLTAGNTNAGPYAMCAKCHDLSNVVADASFRPGTTGKGGHFTHISEQGVSCSVCHTAHGMGMPSANITGERMVNFDIGVVGPNGANPISYNHARNTCTLACHGYNHNADGTVTAIPLPGAAAQTVKLPAR